MSESYMCICNGTQTLIMDPVQLGLSDGGYTEVIPLICESCGKIQFLPEENWKLFLSKGDPEYVKSWEDGFTELVKTTTKRFIRKPIAVSSVIARIKSWFNRR